MKKLGLVVLLTVSCIMMFSLAFAQDAQQAKDYKMRVDGSGSMMDIDNGCGMYSMMGMMRMMGNLVATSDGGVVVMMGNKLYKYDKNLNLKNETEIKIDVKNFQRLLGCPMISDENKDKTKRPIAPEDKSGHESHHP